MTRPARPSSRSTSRTRRAAGVRALAAATWLLVAAGPACAPKRPRIEPVDRGAGPDATTDPVGAALHRDVVEKAGTMEEVPESNRTGRLDASGSGEVGIVLQAGYCYAVLARGEAAVGDLRIRLVDSNRDPRQVDRESGAFASVGLAEPLCPEPTTEYRLELKGASAGGYAVRVFRAAAL